MNEEELLSAMFGATHSDDRRTHGFSPLAGRPSHWTAKIGGRWHITRANEMSEWHPVRWWSPLDLFRFGRDRAWVRRRF